MNADDYIAQLPIDEREEIVVIKELLMREKAKLRQLRTEYNYIQQQMAQRLHTQQSAVFKLERREDMHISTLRSLVEGLGGELDLIVRFPDQPPIFLNQYK